MFSDILSQKEGRHVVFRHSLRGEEKVGVSSTPILQRETKNSSYLSIHGGALCYGREHIMSVATTVIIEKQPKN